MTFITTTIIILLTLVAPIGIASYLGSKRTINFFQELAGKTGLNFALPKRKNILEAPKPALVGDYRNRSVNLITKNKGRTSSVEMAMNCKTLWTAKIEAKGQFLDNYIYTVYNSKFKPRLTGNSVFDKHFFVKVEKEESINLFTPSIRDFLIIHRNNINFVIEIRGYEIVVHDENLSNGERTEGGIAENAVYMLNFMSELADLLERKRVR